LNRPEQMRASFEEARIARERREAQRRYMAELDEQLELALNRIEKTLGGQDVHKWLAEILTDDDEHPVSASQVHDWLSRRGGRRPPVEMIGAVYDADEQFAAWWNKRHGYTVPEKVRQLSDSQENNLLTSALLEFGAAGEAKLRAIRAAKPPPPPPHDWEKPSDPPAREVRRG
jgi:hypothetical protein